MTDHWILFTDYWWLITDHWWLMTDDWWLITGYWWLMTDHWLLITDYWLLITAWLVKSGFTPLLLSGDVVGDHQKFSWKWLEGERRPKSASPSNCDERHKALRTRSIQEQLPSQSTKDRLRVQIDYPYLVSKSLEFYSFLVKRKKPHTFWSHPQPFRQLSVGEHISAPGFRGLLRSGIGMLLFPHEKSPFFVGATARGGPYIYFMRV